MNNKLKKLIPFSLGEYLKDTNIKIVTRIGENVKIIRTDRDNTDFPIIAICTDPITMQKKCRTYSIDGNYCYEGTSSYDLLFLPSKREHKGWVNIYRNDNHYSTGNYSLGGLYLYPSRSEAINGIVHDRKYVTTIKVKWNE